MGILNSVTKLAKSRQGKKALDEAKKLANDPKTKAKIEDVRQRLTSRGDKPGPPR